MSTMMLLPTLSGFRTHSASHRCPCVSGETLVTFLEGFGSLVGKWWCFTRQNWHLEELLQERPLRSFPNGQEHYNTEGWAKVHQPAPLNLCQLIGHWPLWVPLKQFHLALMLLKTHQGAVLNWQIMQMKHSLVL